MENRFEAMNYGHLVGVIDHQNGDRWVVEPEYNWKTARIMADCLNTDPDLDPDKLTEIVESEELNVSTGY